MIEPTYEYVKGQGWVIFTGPKVLYRSECGKFVVVSLKDVPAGMKRGFAPYYHEWEQAVNVVKQGKWHVQAAYQLKDNDMHCCAIRAEDYNKL